MAEIASEPFPRRTFLKLGAVGTAAVALGATGSIIVPELRRKGLMSANGLFDAASMAWADGIYKEVYPTSPLILSPFSDELIVPKALAPVPDADYKDWTNPPGPGAGQQNSLGNEQHQRWRGEGGSRRTRRRKAARWQLPRRLGRPGRFQRRP